MALRGLGQVPVGWHEDGVQSQRLHTRHHFVDVVDAGGGGVGELAAEDVEMACPSVVCSRCRCGQRQEQEVQKAEMSHVTSVLNGETLVFVLALLLFLKYRGRSVDTDRRFDDRRTVHVNDWILDVDRVDGGSFTVLVLLLFLCLRTVVRQVLAGATAAESECDDDGGKADVHEIVDVFFHVPSDV